MNAEIVAIGTELLLGQIVNTNAQYISQRLPEVGVNVYFHSVVGDNPERLKRCLSIAMERSDVIITTGGLGPTNDDITKETIARLLGKELVLHEDILEEIKVFFKRHNREMTQNNIKQAYLPEGSIVIRNRNGTAPGCIAESNGKVFILLPGPPSEMRPMFEESVLPYFMEKSGHLLVSRYIRIFGIGESQVENRIIDIIESQTNPTIAPYAKEGEVMLRVTARCGRGEEPGKLLDSVVDKIRERLGDAVYSIENEELEEVVANLLIYNNITISIAESCTGGLISKKLTDMAGISKVFEGSVISYSNDLKINMLGVNKDTLERYGAVSSQTAIEMANGIRDIT
ncbi:MAG: competence/damage-inducible protein A, partial [Clostridiaceae bacterium]|nr:competence/damage-inducible protein A [Clostridiaceae bacterium]